ncbi:MAG TPA: efflux RND transporter periplasmic adaptor subunit [Candidatus Acidoferrum sp.]|nr:efflux RND transporter periplasmic adaptor subunit [Candidatus Acidoferrum sp.]
MDRKLRNRILLYLLLAGVLAYVGIELSGRKPAPKISAVTPERQNLISSITSNGKVEPLSPYVMRAQLDTLVEKVNVSEGQQVRKGQLLMELDVKDAAAQLAGTRAKLLQAQEDLRAARAGGKADEAAKVVGDLQKAQADRDRFQKNHDALVHLITQQAATKDELALNDLGLLKAQAEVTRLTAAKQEFDRSVKLDTDRSALQVDQLKNEVAALEEKVRQGRVIAPADGTVYSLGRNEKSEPLKAGDYVKVGDLLAEMADLHKVRVKAFIDEPDLGGLEENEPVKITWDALPNKIWLGKTEIIPKQVVQRNTRSVGELSCSVNNDKLDLLPNANVNVRINSRERLGVLSVPRGAVEIEGGRRYVFVVKLSQLGVGKSTLEKREIRVGIADATNYEVVSGLQEGELVALPGDVDLQDGMSVIVVSTSAGDFPRHPNG